MVMEQSKLCESGEKFVRVVTACPEPTCLLATDQQLDDIARFGTNPNRFCMLSIDPTFPLGDFSVTCITYRNLLVTDSHTGQSPVMLGPLFVHHCKSYSTYHCFASSLLGIAPKLAGVLAFRTDGCQSIYTTIQVCNPSQMFPPYEARCSKEAEHRYGISNRGEFLGSREGPTFFEGLVDSRSERSLIQS